jgi:hypothetical protein
MDWSDGLLIRKTLRAKRFTLFLIRDLNCLNGLNGLSCSFLCELCWSYKATLFSLNAFVITDTELNVIAALAIIGLSRRPNNG